MFPFLINAQTIANKVWEANGGTPADDLIYQQSTLDNMENLIIVGNTYTTGQEENVWIAKYDPEGTLLWQYEEESVGILKVYPVPTSDAVTIEFTLEEATDVILNVFDLNGRLIKTVLTGNQVKGTHNVNLSLSEFSNGVYFCHLQTGGKIFTQKIIKIQ